MRYNLLSQIKIWLQQKSWYLPHIKYFDIIKVKNRPAQFDLLIYVDSFLYSTKISKSDFSFEFLGIVDKIDKAVLFHLDESLLDKRIYIYNDIRLIKSKNDNDSVVFCGESNIK